MTVGVLAAAGSRQARRVLQGLEALAPGAAVRFELDLEPEDRVALGEDGITWNGVPLDRLDALYVHGLTYQDPVVPPGEPACDWTLWQAGAVIAQQKHSFLESLLSRVAATGVRLWNPPAAHLAGFDRFGLLHRLAAGGARLPELLCTNGPAAAAAFQQRHPTVVWRPASGPAPWQLFRDRQRDYLVAVDRPPVVLAAAVPGPFLRAYVVGGELAVLLGGNPPNRDGLEQFETFGAIDPAEVAGAGTVAPAVAALGLGWAVASFVATPDGPCFYDLDPDPVLTDLPEPFLGHLTGCLAAGLLGRPLPVLPAQEPVTRPVLLLRRMLTIQFEMEATKYAG